MKKHLLRKLVAVLLAAAIVIGQLPYAASVQAGSALWDESDDVILNVTAEEGATVYQYVKFLTDRPVEDWSKVRILSDVEGITGQVVTDNTKYPCTSTKNNYQYINSCYLAISAPAGMASTNFVEIEVYYDVYGPAWTQITSTGTAFSENDVDAICDMASIRYISNDSASFFVTEDQLFTYTYDNGYFWTDGNGDTLSTASLYYYLNIDDSADGYIEPREGDQIQYQVNHVKDYLHVYLEQGEGDVTISTENEAYCWANSNGHSFTYYDYAEDPSRSGWYKDDQEPSNNSLSPKTTDDLEQTYGIVYEGEPQNGDTIIVTTYDSTDASVTFLSPETPEYTFDGASATLSSVQGFRYDYAEYDGVRGYYWINMYGSCDSLLDGSEACEETFAAMGLTITGTPFTDDLIEYAPPHLEEGTSPDAYDDVDEYIDRFYANVVFHDPAVPYTITAADGTALESDEYQRDSDYNYGKSYTADQAVTLAAEGASIQVAVEDEDSENWFPAYETVSADSGVYTETEDGVTISEAGSYRIQLSKDGLETTSVYLQILSYDICLQGLKDYCNNTYEYTNDGLFAERGGLAEAGTAINISAVSGIDVIDEIYVVKLSASGETELLVPARAYEYYVSDLPENEFVLNYDDYYDPYYILQPQSGCLYEISILCTDVKGNSVQDTVVVGCLGEPVIETSENVIQTGENSWEAEFEEETTISISGNGYVCDGNIQGENGEIAVSGDQAILNKESTTAFLGDADSAAGTLKFLVSPVFTNDMAERFAEWPEAALEALETSRELEINISSVVRSTADESEYAPEYAPTFHRALISGVTVKTALEDVASDIVEKEGYTYTYRVLSDGILYGADSEKTLTAGTYTVQYRAMAATGEVSSWKELGTFTVIDPTLDLTSYIAESDFQDVSEDETEFTCDMPLTTSYGDSEFMYAEVRENTKIKYEILDPEDAVLKAGWVNSGEYFDVTGEDALSLVDSETNTYAGNQIVMKIYGADADETADDADNETYLLSTYTINMLADPVAMAATASLTDKTSSTATILVSDENNKEIETTVWVYRSDSVANHYYGEYYDQYEAAVASGDEAAIESAKQDLIGTCLMYINCYNTGSIVYSNKDESLVYEQGKNEIQATGLKANTKYLVYTDTQSGSGDRKRDILEFTTPAVQAETVTISKPSKTTLKKGDTVKLTATLEPEAEETAPTWTSSDTSVATVAEDGTVKAVSCGKAVITAAIKNGKSSSVTITVDHVKTTVKAVKATVFKVGKTTGYKCKYCSKILTKQKTVAKLKPTLKLSFTKKTLKAKKKATLKLTKLAYGDSVKSVKVTKGTKYVSVKKSKTNTYTITAKKKGKATITVTLKSGKKATCKITVK